MERISPVSLLIVVAGFLLTGIACEKQGAVGPPGEQGPPGLTGERGDSGPAGRKGPRGDMGSIGPEGPEGPRGSMGSRGPAGPAGSKGPRGDRGITGSLGPAGPRGQQGDPGDGLVYASKWFKPGSQDVAEGTLIIDAPAVDEQIVRTGAAYVFMRYPEEEGVYDVQGFLYNSEWVFGYGLLKGMITVSVKSLTIPGAEYSNPLLEFEYRYVVIPGGTVAVGGSGRVEYRDIQREFGITD